MPRVLFDPATADRQQAAHARRARRLALVLALVSGGLAIGLHTETPFAANALGFCDGVRYAVDCGYPVWVYGVAGLIGAAVGWMLAVPALVVASRRPVATTVTCRGCGAAGWLEDLEARAGRCPRCAGGRFDYRAFGVGPVWLPGSVLFTPERIVEDDRSGADLLARHGERRER